MGHYDRLFLRVGLELLVLYRGVVVEERGLSVVLTGLLLMAQTFSVFCERFYATEVAHCGLGLSLIIGRW